LAAILVKGDNRVFERICLCLLGNSPPIQGRDDELLPQWSVVRHEIQARIVAEARAYLRGRCPISDLSFIRLGQLPYRVMFGFWALRLLGVCEPVEFDSLNMEFWRDWMPCAFGNPYSEFVVDGRHEIILKAAYRFAPDRFLEIFEEFLRGQNARSGSVHILDRVRPVWDERIAAVLRDTLIDPDIMGQAFAALLRVLIEAGDDLAIGIATDLVTNIPVDADTDLGRPLEAALQLLSRDAKAGWQIVERAAQANADFAAKLYAKLAFEPFSKATLELIRDLREDQLAEVYLWLAKHGEIAEEEPGFGIVTPGRALGFLARVVIDNLSNRGNKEAHRQICRIQETFPDLRIDFIAKSAEELVRRNTWRALSPMELLSLVSDSRTPNYDGNRPPSELEGTLETIFRKGGGFWALSFEGKTVQIPDRLGLSYIADLLRTPQKAIEAAQLAGARVGSSKPSAVPGIPMADESAIRAVQEELATKKARLKNLQANDWARKGEIHDEISKLEKYLGEVGTHRGQARKVAGTAQRSRTSVTNAINRAIGQISKEHPDLGRHLTKSIKTGTVLIYAPSEVPDWQF